MSLQGKITGRVWRFGKNISTDDLAPSRMFHLRSNVPEFKKYCLIDVDPTFTSTVQKGDIVVADTNFGCGSSREFGPLLLRENGVSAVLAKSFGRIFYRNAINIGLLVIECDTDKLMDGSVRGLTDKSLTIDVEKRLIRKPDDTEFELPFELSDKTIKIIDAGGLLNFVEANGSLDSLMD